MTTEEIKENLRAKIMDFSYKKMNGEERIARGTLNQDIIAENNALPKGISTNEREDYIRYYDINSMGWRSFKIDNFIKFL